MKLKTILKRLLCIATVNFIFFIISCDNSKEIDVIPRQELFSLRLGRLEDQIDLFQIDGMPNKHKNRIKMKEGMFFISNGNASKVSKFTSYGDLLFLLYNPDISPEPIVLQENMENGVITSRIAVKFSLKNIGEIAIDKEDNIYLEDTVPDDQKVWDDTLGIALNSQILKFNRKGQLMDIYGKEGLGNSLFPYISNLHVNNANELIVICRIPDSWIVYWYETSGKIKYSLVINDQNIPTEKNYLNSIDKIIPDNNKNMLYLQLTYYFETLDPATKTKSNIEEAYSKIYTLNVATGKYEKSVKIPDPGKHKITINSGEVEIAASPYEFIGAPFGEYYYLIRPAENNKYQVTILDNAGNKYLSRYLNIEENELYFEQIDVTEQGLIYGLLCFKNKVDFVWWRIDKLLGESKDEDS